MEYSEISKRIYFKSLTLRERQDFLDDLKVNPLSKEDLKSFIDIWKLTVGESSDKFFTARLKWSGIQKRDLNKLLSPIKNSDLSKYDLPGWFFQLEEFLAKPLNAEVSPNILNKDLEEKIPFFHLYIPLSNHFFKQLNIKANTILTEQAKGDLLQNLLTEFSYLGSQSLLQVMLDNNLGYEEICQKIKSNHYKEFFSEYASLARLIFERGFFWLKNSNKLLKDLELKRGSLASLLPKTEESLKVHKINTNFSESHNEGRNVYILETLNGDKFVYKQRSCLLEKSFFKLLDYLNEEFPLIQYKPWLINLDDNSGFMEYIEHKKVSNLQEVQCFYERIGFYLCIFHVLGATDLHSENLIAFGEYPVL